MKSFKISFLLLLLQTCFTNIACFVLLPEKFNDANQLFVGSKLHATPLQEASSLSSPPTSSSSSSSSSTSTSPPTTPTTTILPRLTLAIISHPDSGKTTLTEKLLLHGNAIQEAGAVRQRGNQRRTSSDFLKMEMERGISISSTILSYVYKQFYINLIDTPGHEDFSEDTYRGLEASDNSLLLVDGGKGIESQTLKLHKVVKLKQIPIFTVCNKFDRPSKSPLF